MNWWKKFYSVGITADELRLLLQKGADPNGNAEDVLQPPLHMCCISNDLVQAEILLQHGADPNQLYDRYAPLHLSARRGRVDTTRLLLQYGANVDLQDTKGWTALHQSVFFPDTVECLLEHGAEIGLLTRNGQSALQMAEDAGKIGEKSVRLLKKTEE